MRLHKTLLAVMSALSYASPLAAQESLADLLDAPGVQISRPADRARVVARMEEIQNDRRNNAQARAMLLGLPLRKELPNGRVQELADFSGDKPVYLTTHNVNAAKSTGANLLQSPPFSLTGTGVSVGVWDGGSGLSTHSEFGGRLIVKDASASIDHATHVAGTISASGVTAAAKGMATAATIDSYDWNSDTSEMTSRGATYAAEPGKIYLSNHSYGYISGWNYVNNGTRVWEWNGGTIATASSVEPDFGLYNSYARDGDSLAYNAPYYLIFRSAGNDRGENPTTGEKIALAPNSGTVVNYDPALHPMGDAFYRGGFDTISYNAIGKNVITVGSVADAVDGSGLRKLNLNSVSSFSSWGPTDDGRIKPDVVANGEAVYSPLKSVTYGSYSGTSMATPNATGSAALLIQQYSNYFPGQAMRSSTLKSLLIHTADDLGNAGPDYKYGWGLINVKAAADLIKTSFETPEKPSLIENQLTTSVITRTHSFAWDGVSPIRATLGWTDPAGSVVTVSDSRAARLVNNLNLKIIAPGGSDYQPFVMPFVGTWTQAAMNLPATSGTNNTDNIEQVLIAAPPVAGVYQAIVSFTGTLTNANQRYSLILSGTASSGPAPPSLISLTPDSGEAGNIPVTLSGSNFSAGSTVKFSLAGQPDVFANVSSISSSTIQCTLNTGAMAAGIWNVTVTSTTDQSSTLTSAFAVIGTIWSRNFDPISPNWSSSAIGSNPNNGVSYWTLTSTSSHSPSTSWFASGPASKNTDSLVSEAIPIPASTSQLQLSFWHRYNLENGNDGAVLEFSLDNGSTWFQVTTTGSAEAITLGGYTHAFPNNHKSDLSSRSVWSGNSGLNFTEVIVSLKDTAKYGGKSLRARWRLGTNTSVSSPGWYIDSLKLKGAGGSVNQPPSLATAAAASSSIVTGQTTNLTVAATDDGGETNLSYTWSVTGGSFERPVTSRKTAATPRNKPPPLSPSPETTASRSPPVIPPEPRPPASWMSLWNPQFPKSPYCQNPPPSFTE